MPSPRRRRIVAIDATIPYWLEGLGPCWAPLTRDEDVDVAIVGGGVTGLACARLLASAGLRVRLVEARTIGSGASGRNGGFALRGLAVPYADVRDPALMRVTEEAVTRVAELAGDAFRAVGSLYIAKTEPELELVRAEYDALRADGFAVELVDRGDLPPSLRPSYAGGLHHPTDGVLEPGRWGRRLAGLAVEAGAALAEETRALRLDGRSVVTARGFVSAEQVVVATDGYTAGLVAELDDAIAPARNQVVATAPLGERLFELAVYARDGYDYWQQTREGRLVVGGRRDADRETEATAEEAVTATIQRELEALVHEITGREHEITHRWAGILGFTADRLPLVGRVPGRDGVWASLGYSGHGNALAVWCGEAVGRAILGNPDPRLAAFSPGRIRAARPRA
jgi:gamma-glutamylputrescine oxidase